MDMNRIKQFNIAGTCEPSRHYMLPVLPRLPGIGKMIERENYFILHAPRQSGKTTYLKFLTDKINQDGQWYALNCSLASVSKTANDDMAMTKVVSQINMAMTRSTISTITEKAYYYNSLPGMQETDTKVATILNQLCRDLDKDLVVFFDEADRLVGPALLSFLTQIRDGYLYRSNSPGTRFPRSLALVGMRNILDYLASNHPETEGQHLASPFNIVTERMTLANFSQDEIGCLYRQHTEASGQAFQDSAIERAWYWTEGQPWLVNALAYEIVERQLGGDNSQAITGSDVDQAAKSLIKGYDTHFDSLRARIDEPRVRRVMEPIVASADNLPLGLPKDDITYVFELGLLKRDPKNNLIVLPANPIYEEVIARALTEVVQESLPTSLANKWINKTYIDMNGLLQNF
jgi:hypothetical protein